MMTMLKCFDTPAIGSAVSEHPGPDRISQPIEIKDYVEHGQSYVMSSVPQNLPVDYHHHLLEILSKTCAGHPPDDSHSCKKTKN